jgi:ABC-2 type transport system permease protein
MSIDRGIGRFWTLMRFEWRLFARTRSPWLVALLFILLSAAAIVNGRAELQRGRGVVEAAAREQAALYAAVESNVASVEGRQLVSATTMSGLPSGLPSAGAVETQLFGFRAAIPPLPTAVLSMGQTQMRPQRYQLRSGARFSPFGRTVGTKILSGFFPERPTDNPSATLLGAFDLGFMATYVFPLLILALAYDIVSGDRDLGTLALVAAQPISFRRWLGVKVIVRAAFITGVGVLVPAIGVMLPLPSWSDDALIRFAFWMAAVAAYGAFWLLLAVLVSVRTSSPALSVAVGTMAWLVFVIVLPATMAISVPLFVPASASLSYATAERAASLDINPQIDAANSALNRIVRSRFSNGADARLFTESIELPVGRELFDVLPQPPWSAVMPAPRLSRALAEARRTLFEQQLDGVLTELHASEQREERLSQIARYCSPALLFQAIVDDAAGTGRHRWQRFVGQLDDYIRRRDGYFTRKILANEHITSADFGFLIPFRYREEDTSDLFVRLVAPVIALLAMAGGLGTACFLASRRWR